MALINSLEENQANNVAQEVFEKLREQSGNVPELAKVMAWRSDILKEFTSLFWCNYGEGRSGRSFKMENCLYCFRNIKV